MTAVAFDGFEGNQTLTFWNHVFQIPRGSPRGAQMRRPRDRVPEEIPRGCLGVWAMVELTDA